MKADNMGIATSQGFPDALSGAAFCGKNKAVLLLADDKALLNSEFAKAYKNTIETAYVFGGQNAVGANTWNALVNSLK